MHLIHNMGFRGNTVPTLTMPSVVVGIDNNRCPMRATVLGTGGRIGKQAIVDNELVEIAGLCVGYIARKILMFVRNQRDLRWISFELGIATHPNSDLRRGSRPNPKMRAAALLCLG